MSSSLRCRTRIRRATPLLLIAALAVAVPHISFAATIRITCADGGGDLIEAGGRSLLSVGLCDVDRTADGYCTFAFVPACPSCLLRTIPCSPDGLLEACSGPPAFPCPYSVPHYVLPTPRRAFHRTHRRIHVHSGTYHATFVLRCEIGLGLGVFATQIDSSATPNLIGDWTLTETGGSTTDCPVQVTQDLTTPSLIRVAEQGNAVRACLDLHVDYPPTANGTVSEAGFVIDTGDLGLYSESIASTSAPNADMVAVTEHWLVPPPPHTLFCASKDDATMFRVPPIPCQNDADCLTQDACTRCVQARCLRSPLCQ